MSKYPVGLQSFANVRQDGFLYIDKTAQIYKMLTEGKAYFLSRPRRFGKSLLVSTLKEVFSGQKKLFEAFTTEDGIQQPPLFIAQTNWKWRKYPVIHFDFSETSLKNHNTLDEYIDYVLSSCESEFGVTTTLKESGHRFSNLVRMAHKQAGQQCVVLVDEYDNQMLHAIGNKELETYVRDTFTALFSPLNNLDEHLKFVFITGITKFSQMGIFSTLNQLNNISMQRQYETICGISEQELVSQLRPDIEQLAQQNGLAYDVQLSELKRMYDGYHFCSNMTDIYNPFSLMKAFSAQEISDYWFESGTSGAVVDLLAKMPPVDLSAISAVQCEASEFDRAFNSYSSLLPVLYQSGYLTIKDYDRELDEYTLGFPNQEVSKGFANCLYLLVTNRQDKDDPDKSRLLRAYKIFRRDNDLPPFIDAIKAFFAGVPHQLDGGNEHYYHALLYTLLVAFGADVTSEESTAQGRSDIVLRMPKTVYVLEIKYEKTAGQAIRQIEEKDYAGKYRLDERPVAIVGINFSAKERNITEWEICE